MVILVACLAVSNLVLATCLCYARSRRPRPRKVPAKELATPPISVIYGSETEYDKVNAIFDRNGTTLLDPLELVKVAAEQASADVAESDLLRVSLGLELDGSYQSNAKLQTENLKLKDHVKDLEKEVLSKTTAIHRLNRKFRNSPLIHLAPLSFSVVQSVDTAPIEPARTKL